MNKKDVFFVWVFLIISFLIFLPQYISNKIIGWLDMIYYFVPFKEIIVENLKNGNLPLWNPYLYCGQPLLANFQSAIFYPMNIFYYALPIEIAFKINTFLIYFIMSAFLYLFFRQLNLTEEGAFISSFLFSFSIYMTTKSAEWADLHTIAWMPATLFFSKISINKNRIINKFLTLICLTMSFLAGHPQVFIYMFLLFTAFYFFWAGFKGFKNYIVFNLCIVLITLVQILPTLEFIGLSSRASEYKLFYDVHNEMYMQFEHLLQFFFPFIKKFFSGISSFLNWMALIDIGLSAIFLSGLGIARMSDIKLKDFLLVLFTISFIFSFFNAIPYYNVFYKKLFFLHFIRYPAKINVILFFILCFFAGIGFDILFKNNKKENLTFFIFVIITNIIFIFVSLFLIYNKINIMKFFIKTFYPYANFKQVYNFSHNYHTLLNDIIVFLIFLFIFMILMYLIIYKNLKSFYVKLILMIFVILNVFIFNKSNYGYYLKYNDFTDDTEISKFIKNRKDITKKRILSPLLSGYHMDKSKESASLSGESRYYFVRTTFQPNIPFYYRLYNMDGFDSLIIKNFYDFRLKINRYKVPWDNSFFSLLSTKYVFSNNIITGKTIKKIYADKINNMYIFEKENVPDIIYFVPLKYAVYVKNREEEYKELYDSKYVYDKKIVINKKYEDEFKKYSYKKLNNKTILVWERKNINSLVININNATNGFVVVAENFYPGWIAKVNGVKKEIIKVNGFLKGIFVENGKNIIELEYKPIILYAGYIISLISLFFMILLLFLRRNYERI